MSSLWRRSAVVAAAAVLGLVLAGCYASPDQTVPNRHYAGYTINGNGTYTSIKANFNVPHLHCGFAQSDVSIWIGLGAAHGPSGHKLAQVGLYGKCPGLNLPATWNGIYMIYPQMQNAAQIPNVVSPTPGPTGYFPVKENDTVLAMVWTHVRPDDHKTYADFLLSNQTQNSVYPWELDNQVVNGPPAPPTGGDAAWIVELPDHQSDPNSDAYASYQLAHFDPVTFTNAFATTGALLTNRIKPTDGPPKFLTKYELTQPVWPQGVYFPGNLFHKARPGALTAQPQGDRFTVTYSDF